MSNFLSTVSSYKTPILLGTGVLVVGVILMVGGSPKGEKVSRQESLAPLRDTLPPAVSQQQPYPPIDSVIVGYQPAGNGGATAEDFQRALRDEMASQRSHEAPAQQRVLAPRDGARMQVVDFPDAPAPDPKTSSRPLVEVPAAVVQTTQLVNGGNLDVRLLGEVLLPDGQVVSAHSVIVAKADIQGGRIKLNFQRVRTQRGDITAFSVSNVIDYYDLRDDIRRQVSLKTMRKEERVRQLNQIRNTTLSQITSSLEGQFLPVTGGILTNLVRITSQASTYIPEATLPEGYLLILQMN